MLLGPQVSLVDCSIAPDCQAVRRCRGQVPAPRFGWAPENPFVCCVLFCNSLMCLCAQCMHPPLQVTAGGPFLGMNAISGAAALKLAGWLMPLCTLLAVMSAL